MTAADEPLSPRERGRGEGSEMHTRSNPPLPTRTRSTAKTLRTKTTDADAALWYHLRDRRLAGLKFRRQHPIPPYVVDFYCGEARLIVELDGSQHYPSADASRTEMLERQGFLIVRFWDNKILVEMERVLNEILHIASDRTLTRPFGAPSPEGRGKQQKA